MALKGDGADASYLNTTSTNASTSFFLTGIFQGSEDDPAGEQDLITFALASPFYYFAIRYDVSGGTRENLRLATHAGYYELPGTAGNASDWFGLGLSCGGTGSSDFVITFQANQAATPVTFTRSMDGGTWTPGYLRLFSGYARGAAAAAQNIKYGNQYRNATQMQQEFWTTTLVNSGGTVTQTEMVTGDLTAQREAFTVNGTVTVITGPLEDTGGDAPTIAVSTASVSGDEFTISGTYTEDSGGGLAVQILDIVGGSTVQTITPSWGSGTYSATFRATVAGSHTLRASISDSNGTDTDDSSALTVVSLTGTDELPYTWPLTTLSIVPASISIENGQVASFTVLDQAGNPIRGVTPSTVAVASFTATDMDGKGTVTGSSVGSASIVVSALTSAGGTVTASIPLTVTAASGAVVTVSPATATARPGENVDFDATVTGSTQGVTWSVESGSGSIDTDGNYVATVPGSVVIRATSVEFPASYADATLTIAEDEVSADLSVSFLSDATQSAQVGALLVFTLSVRQDGFPLSGATISVSPSTASAFLSSASTTTDSNGRGSIQITILDGAPVDLTVVLTFTVTSGDAQATVTGYLQIVSELYGVTELRGVQYARPRARNV